MKEFFKKKRFSPESAEILQVAISVINNYAEQGYKLSLRQLYYQLVSKNVVPNTEQSYKRVGDIITDARMAGLADWDMIEDRNRECLISPTWETPGSIIESAAYSYQIDKWANQPAYCEVMVEKQALEGVLHPVCVQMQVPFTANKGYSSVTMMYYAGRRIARRFLSRVRKLAIVPEAILQKAEDVRPVHLTKWMHEKEWISLTGEVTEEGSKNGIPQIIVFYLGDHDPSGIDMTRDVQEWLLTFSDYVPIQVKRLALNMDQIEELNPPENPAKMTDSRAADYVSKFGESSWELDAVEPAAMAKMVRNAVYDIRDQDKWEEITKREDRERDILKQLAKTANKKANGK